MELCRFIYGKKNILIVDHTLAHRTGHNPTMQYRNSKSVCCVPYLAPSCPTIPHATSPYFTTTRRTDTVPNKIQN